MYQETELTYKELITKMKSSESALVLYSKNKMWVPKKMFNELSRIKHIDNEFAKLCYSSGFEIFSYDPETSDELLMQGLYRDFGIEDIMTEKLQIPQPETKIDTKRIFQPAPYIPFLTNENYSDHSCLY